MTKLHLGLSSLAFGAIIWACSTSGTGGSALTDGQGGIGNVFAGGSSSTLPNPNAGGSIGSLGPLTSSTPSPDGGNYRRPKVCDANGENCKCINLASLGDRASSSYGVGSDGKPSSTTSFDTWLSEKSNANVQFVFNYQALTPEYLAGFDVIILQDLRKWSLTASDIQNLSDWVNGGGGLIALNGYMNGNDDEVTASNKALAFSKMSYIGGAESGSVPRDQSTCEVKEPPWCPPQGNKQTCCYCWNGTLPVIDWDTSHPVAKDIKAVGAIMGRQVSPGDGTVVAKYDGKAVAASKEIGSGKVFLWCDEWVTYTSSWSGGQVNSGAKPEELQYQPCYDTTIGKWLTADVALQSMQFWYNAIRYVSPPTECDFVIDEPEHVILL